MLIEPGEVHRTLKLEGQPHASFHVICIAPGLVETLAREAARLRRRTFRPRNRRTGTWCGPSGACTPPCPRMAGRSSSGRAGSPIVSPSCSTGTANAARATDRLPAPPDSGARDFLHEHYFDPIALETLARIAGVSRFHFLRLFARQFGLPPHAYQTNLRIEKPVSS